MGVWQSKRSSLIVVLGIGGEGVPQRKDNLALTQLALQQGYRLPYPISFSTPVPAPGDVTTLSQSGGSWGVPGASGPQAGSPGFPTAPTPRGLEDEKSQFQIWGRSGVGGAPGPQKGGAEAPGELRCLARSAAPDADTVHGTLCPRPVGAVGNPGHGPSCPRASSSLPVWVSTGSRLSESLSLRVHISRGPHSSSSIPPRPPHPSPCRIRSGLQPGPPSEHKGREAWKHKAGAAHPAPVSPVRPVRPVHPGTCGLRMLLPAPGRPGLRRLGVRARPELPGGRGKNPLRLPRPQPVTSPLPPRRLWGLAVNSTAHAHRDLSSEAALLGHVPPHPSLDPSMHQL